ncbi:SET domain-containing protein [Daedaleopsis nitida]|nr:SET domain-containing protein [Daedaleopsis nitida]
MSLRQFHQWLTTQNIQCHAGTKILYTEDVGMSVVCRTTAPIIHPQRLAVIPKASILSVRSCALSRHIPWAPYGHDATLALSLALYSEILRCDASRWAGYLCSLTADIVPIARLWGHNDAFPDDEDSSDAAQWIQGTEVHKELYSEDGTSLTEDIDTYYRTHVVPILIANDYRPSIHGFLHAYSLVCSRAFLVDSYHGLSMVPVADGFNHIHENHVQLASEYDVCPVCGSLSECPHDREEDSRNMPSVSPQLDPTDTVDMITVRSIPAGAEIYNTYGSNLSNAALLGRYGFLLDDGETDVVTFGWPGSGLIVDRTNFDWSHDLPDEVRGEVEAILEQSALVFKSDLRIHDESSLCINSDGQVSTALFLWVVMDVLSQMPELETHGGVGPGVSDAMADTILHVANALVCFETEEASSSNIPDDQVLRAVLEVAGALVGLCRARIAHVGMKPYRGASAEILGELMDNLCPERTKTRLALQYLLGERAILEACASGWEELRDKIIDLDGYDSD